MKHVILLAAIIIYCRETSYSQAGKLDSSFGGKGWITEDYVKINNYYETVTEIFPQKNGSYILVIGGLNNGPNALARFLPNGRLDKRFGKAGYLTITYMNIAKVVQGSDGKFIIAGFTYNDYNKAIVARYNSDGSTDYTFSGDGRLNTAFRVTSLNVQDNGKVVISNSKDSTFIARYNIDGSPDVTFDEDGTLKYYFNDGLRGISYIKVQKDEKIIIAGGFFTRTICTKCGPLDGKTEPVLVRLNSNGTLDLNFGENGIKFTSGGILALQEDEKIILAKTQGKGVFLTRYNSDGSPDADFNKDGPEPAEFEDGVFPSSIAFQKNGKIVIAGSTGGDRPETSKDFALMRYQKNGKLDKSFSEDGKLTTDFGFNDFAQAVAIQNNGRIMVAGGTTSITNWDYAIAQYKNDGSPDNGFYEEGKKIAYVPVGKGSLRSIAVQNDGKTVVAGDMLDSVNRSNFFIARYNSDGSPDKTFSGDGKQVTDFGFSYSHLNTLTIQHDGKIVVAGTVIISAYPDPDTGYMAIARYNTDGTPDSTFSDDGRQETSLGNNYLSASVSSLAVQEDGKILAGGVVTDIEWNHHVFLARYYTDGSLDNSFGKDGIATVQFAPEYNNASSLAIDQNKKIIMAGGTNMGDNNDFALVRFNDDGTLDKTFGTGGKLTTDFEGNHDSGNSLAIQNDGKIVVAGVTAESDFEYDFSIARYNNDGSLDNTFGMEGKSTVDFGYNDGAYAVNIQEDGKIVLTGLTFSYIDPVANDILIARYNIDGTLDSSFGLGGKVRSDLGGSERGDAAVIYNNRLYVAGVNSIACFDLTGLGNEPPIVKTLIRDNIMERAAAVAAKADTDGMMGLTLRPNPTRDILKIQTIGLQQDKPTTISIISGAGTVVRTIQSKNSGGIIQLDLSALNNGVYFVKLVNGTKVFHKKFLKF